MKNEAQPLQTALCVTAVNSETFNTKCVSWKVLSARNCGQGGGRLASPIYHFLFISATFQHGPSSSTPQQKVLCCGQKLVRACRVSIEIHHGGGFQELVNFTQIVKTTWRNATECGDSTSATTGRQQKTAVGCTSRVTWTTAAAATATKTTALRTSGACSKMSEASVK